MHIEHLERAYKQIDNKGKKLQRIAEFMAIGIDKDMNTMQNDIA